MDRKLTRLTLPYSKYWVDINLRPESGVWIDAYSKESFHEQQKVLLTGCIKAWNVEIDGKKLDPKNMENMRQLDLEDYTFLVNAISEEAKKCGSLTRKKKASSALD